MLTRETIREIAVEEAIERWSQSQLDNALNVVYASPRTRANKRARIFDMIIADVRVNREECTVRLGGFWPDLMELQLPDMIRSLVANGYSDCMVPMAEMRA